MRIKNKKSLFAIIALFLIIGVTIAYFQSSASFENIFNTGTYKVVTTEVFESPDNWKPGEEIPKTITTKNEGTIPAAVRVKYIEKWEDSEGTDITSSIPAGAVVINLDNTSDWTKEGNYYYYNYILNPNETTSSFIKSVTLNAQLGSGDDVDCTPSQDGLSVSCEATDSLYGAKYKLTLTKETVQADKYKEVWNTNVEITEKQGNSTPYYVYANNYSEAHLTSASDGSTEKLSSTNDGDGVYLRYRVLNDELVTPPDTCINDISRTENGELCLAYGADNFANNTDLIKDFFNIDDSEIVDGSYSGSQLECTFNSNESYCGYGTWWYVSASSSGSVEANDLNYTFFCNVDSASEYYCDGQ